MVASAVFSRVLFRFLGLICFVFILRLFMRHTPLLLSGAFLAFGLLLFPSHTVQAADTANLVPNPSLITGERTLGIPDGGWTTQHAQTNFPTFQYLTRVFESFHCHHWIEKSHHRISHTILTGCGPTHAGGREK